jgi:hypothetical protein
MLQGQQGSIDDSYLVMIRFIEQRVIPKMNSYCVLISRCAYKAASYQFRQVTII